MDGKVLLLKRHLKIVGDRKLVPHFVGSFSIVQWFGPLAYQPNLGIPYRQVYTIFYISLPKFFHTGGDGYPHSIAVYIDDKQEWKFSGILRHKGLGRRNYLVAYSGYKEYKAFWLPESEIYNSLEIMNDYKVFHGLT